MATYRASNTLAAGTRANSTLNKPAGTASGDLLVMFFNIETDILPLPPTGWRFGYNIDHAGAAVDQWIFWKRAGASEPASYTITHASTWTQGYIVAVQNVSPSVNPNYATAAQGTSTTATANSVTTTGADAWIGFFVNTFGDMGGGVADTISPPAGSTPTFTRRYNSGHNIFAADGTLASAGATGTKSISFSASQQWMATMLVAEDTATTSTAPFVVQPAYATLAASASPSVTFNVPVAENDIVVMWASSTAVATLNAAPSGWVNVLGGTTLVASDSHSLACVYHKVTLAEATAQTLTYTATSLFTAAQTGYVHAALVRNVDPTTPIDDAASTFNSGNTITPHVLAGLAGANVGTGSLVLSAVAKDATGAYQTLPSGWEFLASTDTNQGLATLRREATTSSGVAVATTNITPSAGDEYASITVALTPGPTGPTTVNGTAASDFGGLTATAVGTKTVGGAIASNLGGLTATANGARLLSGTALGDLGGLTATASGSSSTPSVTGTAASDFGALTVTASGVRQVAATAAGNLGALSATATGSRAVSGQGATDLSTLTATAVGTKTIGATAASDLGGLSATATGTKTVAGTAVANLGGLTATGSDGGVATVPGSAASSFGGLTATAAGTKTVLGVAASDLGALDATAAGTVETPAVEGTATGNLGGLTATAAGVRSVAASSSSNLGGLSAVAAGTRTVSGTATVDFGALTSNVYVVLTIELPDGRTLVVPFHNRTLAIPAESRMVEVAAQSRIMEIPA